MNQPSLHVREHNITAPNYKRKCWWGGANSRTERDCKLAIEYQPIAFSSGYSKSDMLPSMHIPADGCQQGFICAIRACVPFGLDWAMRILRLVILYAKLWLPGLETPRRLPPTINHLQEPHRPLATWLSKE